MLSGASSSACKSLTSTLKYFRYTFAGREGKKLYEKYPLKYKKVSRINTGSGFDLRDPNLTFPINVPLKITYKYAPQKSLFIDNRKDIDFNRLLGNQVLLAFQELSSLTPSQVITGLERLSIQPGQEQHKWNQHPWINLAFEHIKTNRIHYKQDWTLRLYNVMKKLNNKDPEMWKLIYGRVQKEIFKMKTKDFIYFWETYHNDKTNFSPEFVSGLFKLMETKLRNFSDVHIIKAMQIMEEHGMITHFYTHNVFLPLFKSPEKKFSATQINEVLKVLMLYNIERFDRFYDEFYPKLLTVKCETSQEARGIKESLLQMQDIFQSHIITPYVEFFQVRERELKNKLKVVEQKQLFQMVQSDIHYYEEKLKMRTENS